MKLFVLFFLFVVQPGFSQQEKSRIENDTKTPELESEDSDLAMEALYAARQSFDKAQKKVRDDYRKEYRKVIALTETVEVFLLDFEMVGELPDGELAVSSSVLEGSALDLEEYEELDEEPPAELPQFMEIEPYEAYSKILKRRTLDARLVKEAVRSVSDQLLEPDEDTSAWCHYPIHGIRLATKKGEILFQTSFCHACGNYFFRYPEYESKSDWIDFSSEKLAGFLKKEMPIPQAELDRFDAKYGSKEKKEEE